MSLEQPQAVLSYLVSPVFDGVEQLRLRLGREVVSLVSTDPEPDMRAFAVPAGDPGLFAPDSPAWEVHADASMFVGGIRALLLQAMHPLAMAGVAEHSDYKRQPLRRLQRTAEFIRDTTYGNRRQVREATRRVRQIHKHVKGIAPDGRRYSASDPELLRWVHAAEVDSFLTAYERYGAKPITRARADRYLDEMAEVAILLGADWVPRSQRELKKYLRDVRPDLVAGEQARETAEWLLRTPAHARGWLPQMILNVAAIGLLPAWVRRELGLVPVPFVDPLLVVDPLIVRPTATALVRTLGWALAPNIVREAAQQRWKRKTKVRRTKTPRAKAPRAKAPRAGAKVANASGGRERRAKIASTSPALSLA
ncbi:MAG: DUF2236 domain-containing protein [Deltaproteobacteria bacterium]|nr:DUF2236 domain-containing protein [Deltaproteobacteria bacterium]